MRLFQMTNLIILPFFLILTSCYYTSQSYNHGKLLDPGDVIFTGGVGLSPQKVKVESEQYIYEEYYDEYYDTSYEILTYKELPPTYETKMCRSFGLNFQLGVHDKLPFGGGIEVGLMFEASYFVTEDNYGERTLSSNILPALDFNARLGFRDKVLSRSLYQHNLELGWITGMWLDNGWFLGYSGGWEFDKIIPYLGIRAIILPTNLVEHKEWMGSDNFFKKHDQKFNVRGSAGISFKLKRVRVLPDYITPEITVTGPHGAPFSPVSTNFHVGFRWTNGL